MPTDLNSLIDEADEGSRIAFRNYGKITWEVTRYIIWADGKPLEVDAAEYAKAPKKVAGKNAKNMEITFTQDIQEFKPDLTFSYSRKVTIGDRDWNATVEPSLEAICGKGLSAAAMLAKVQGAYCATVDVAQKKNADYNTIKFAALYTDRDACLAAMNGEPAKATASNGFNVAEWASLKPDIDKAVKDKIKELKSPIKAKEAVAAEYQLTVPQLEQVLA